MFSGIFKAINDYRIHTRDLEIANLSAASRELASSVMNLDARLKLSSQENQALLEEIERRREEADSLEIELRATRDALTKEFKAADDYAKLALDADEAINHLYEQVIANGGFTMVSKVPVMDRISKAITRSQNKGNLGAAIICMALAPQHLAIRVQEG
jgi:uncharacterized protein (DUF3084 family)